MNASLTLRYEFSRDADDDFGWLQAEVRTGGITASYGFWVQWQDLTEWVPHLEAFPLPAPAQREWGQVEPEGKGYRPIIKIAIFPANPVGTLRVEVFVSDRDDERIHAAALFRTQYANLGRFAGDLNRMMGREAEEAVLTGTDVA